MDATEFLPPNEQRTQTAQYLHFQQYIKWICSLSPMAGSFANIQTLFHCKLAAKRMSASSHLSRSSTSPTQHAIKQICLDFKSGLVPVEIFQHLLVGHENEQQVKVSLPKLSQFTGPTVTPSQAKTNYLALFKAMYNYCRCPVEILPDVQGCLNGSFSAISQLLYVLFHHFVLRERFSLWKELAAWYLPLLSLYGLTSGPHHLLRLGDFSSGTILICAFHNINMQRQWQGEGEGIFDLFTVYRHPQNIEERIANISFLYSLLDVFDIQPFFPRVVDFVSYGNNDFLFMQVFSLFQLYSSAFPHFTAVNCEVEFADPPHRDLLVNAEPTELLMSPDQRLQSAQPTAPWKTVVSSSSSTLASVTTKLNLEEKESVKTGKRSSSASSCVMQRASVKTVKKEVDKAWRSRSTNVSEKKAYYADSTKCSVEREDEIQREAKPFQKSYSARKNRVWTPPGEQLLSLTPRETKDSREKVVGKKQSYYQQLLLRRAARPKTQDKNEAAHPAPKTEKVSLVPSSPPSRKQFKQPSSPSPSLESVALSYQLRLICSISHAMRVEEFNAHLDLHENRLIFSLASNAAGVYSLQLRKIKNVDVTPVHHGGSSSLEIRCEGACSNAPPPYQREEDPVFTFMFHNADDAVSLHAELAQLLH